MGSTECAEYSRGSFINSIIYIYEKYTLFVRVHGTAMRSLLNKLELGCFHWNEREWSDRA